MINETHDPDQESWVESANDPDTDFPLQNLPFGVFDRANGAVQQRVGVAIGDQVLDLVEASAQGLLGPHEPALFSGSLEPIMAQRPTVWRSIRRLVSTALRRDTDAGRRAIELRTRVLLPASELTMRVPARRDYTDFYASVFHATNVGSMFRPDQPLLPNYKWVPIGYHGRASSIVVSGTPVHRPRGQISATPAGPPTFGVCRRLDYEVELGAWIGGYNPLGTPESIATARDRLFGLTLLNDWSARDLQTWEYQPLGPFLAKNFATSVSPWVVTREALAPFRCAPYQRPAGDPSPLPYLTDAVDQESGAFDIVVEAWLRTAAMRAQGVPPICVSSARARDLYWTFTQLVAHHASGGCNLGAGDLLGSGTVSGPARENRGCLLELTWRGTEPLVLPNGEQRTFLDDGDEVILRGRATREGFRTIGFGECTGIVLPST
jgi:fumarylacetoacetase